MFLMLSREHGSTETPRDSPKATGLGWKPDLLMPSASPQDSLCPSDHSFLPKPLEPWGMGHSTPPFSLSLCQYHLSVLYPSPALRAAPALGLPPPSLLWATSSPPQLQSSLTVRADLKTAYHPQRVLKPENSTQANSQCSLNTNQIPTPVASRSSHN